MTGFRIAVLAGDGVGPEILLQAELVAAAAAELHGVSLDIEHALIGGAALDAIGEPLPEATRALCRASDAVLLGAVGGPKWDAIQPATKRPESGALLPIRKELGLYANLRPVRVHAALRGSSPLRRALEDPDVDLMVVRELTGGIYFGQPRHRDPTGEFAVDTCVYSRAEIERIAETGFRAAASRRGRMCSVDKANVLETSRLWRETVTGMGLSRYPDLELSHMLVDNAAMQLIRNPAQFDVIVTENMFGDILSDEAAMLTGSLGMLASASLGSDFGPAGHRRGLFEPAHGSAPDIAGRDVANPLAAILSVALMFRYSLDCEPAAVAIEAAVDAALTAGCRTADIAAPGECSVGTRAIGAAVLQRLKEQTSNRPGERHEED
ncbi:MAG: 3-isopropylmalate dehydrogenase [Armatimonadetes bacterium]|nr:3-isopropylmalate dehydrogenase [Armatimonadota bacterium]MDE2206491.1 3-isopropylmalate dehydrogenase [Armatimonadota bacterium]